MILLPEGCTCSQLSVSPKNWKTSASAISVDWQIQYYFRDPNEMDRYPNGKLIVVKGMNCFKNIQERRAVTKQIMQHELENLRSGFNPIKAGDLNRRSDFSPRTPFIEALENILCHLSCAHNTRIDIKSTIRHIAISARKLRYDTMPIGKIRRKHLKQILENCKASNNTYNAYRKNLGILFKELVEYDVVETNYLRDISKRKVVKRIKKILSHEECKKISDWAFKNDYQFYLLIHIFFHSGCRTTEIFRVKRKHVNLTNQTLFITVMKGNQPFEVLKPIKDIAVKFWEEAIVGAGPDDYIFSKGLQPGPLKINPRQATRRWKRHIKSKLFINCNWYSLKYLNTDQIAESEGINSAAVLNSHTNIRTTMIYVVGERKRRMESIKKMKNYFA